MKRFLNLAVTLAASALLTGCLSPSGDTTDEQKVTVQKMSDSALTIFYKKNPGLEKHLKTQAGFAVFKNMGIDIFLPSTESGWGVVYDNKTGKKTYMKMFSFGIGLGLGIRDFRALYTLATPDDIKYFIEHGWGLGVQANAVFKFGETGAGIAEAIEIRPGIQLYKFTQNGVALHATVQGTKIWENDVLTNSK